MENFSREETLMFLGMYTLHPRDWELIINHIRDNSDLLPDDSCRDVYSCYDTKKLKVRLSTKLHQLLNMPVQNIQDTDVRERIIEVRRMDPLLSSFNSQEEATVTSSSSSDDVPSFEGKETDEESRSDHDVRSCKRRHNIINSCKRRHDSSSSYSDETSNIPKRIKKRKRKKTSKTVKKKSVIGSITNTVSSIVRAALGVSSRSSDSSDSSSSSDSSD